MTLKICFSVKVGTCGKKYLQVTDEVEVKQWGRKDNGMFRSQPTDWYVQIAAH
jgi:hypothetical protein